MIPLHGWKLFKAYKKEHVDLAKRMSKGTSKAVCKIAAKTILNKTLQMRKECVGSLLKAIRLTRIIKKIFDK